MKQGVCRIGILMIGGIIAGCVGLVPGADQVKITMHSDDVKGCTPVGNVSAQGFTDPIDIQRVLQNQAVGLGANIVFETVQGQGVAYRCGRPN
jgi:hypothetical protein